MLAELGAYHNCWRQRGPAAAMHSDGEGARNKDAAKSILNAKGTELRIRARSQRATTVEARNGIPRHTLH
eukprot:2293403-Pyramimonas_sp.AAC.1